jgi:hypothetical protein
VYSGCSDNPRRPLGGDDKAPEGDGQPEGERQGFAGEVLTQIVAQPLHFAVIISTNDLASPVPAAATANAKKTVGAIVIVRSAAIRNLQTGC